MPTDEDFAADLAQVRALVARDDIDGFYAGVVSGDELDYVLAHRFDDPERVGMQALSLLAYHVLTISEEANLPPEQVAEDAVRLAGELDRGSDQPPEEQES